MVEIPDDLTDEQIIANLESGQSVSVQSDYGNWYILTRKLTLEDCERAGVAAYSRAGDVHIAFGNWCDRVVLTLSRQEAFNLFLFGWDKARQLRDAETFNKEV